MMFLHKLEFIIIINQLIISGSGIVVILNLLSTSLFLLKMWRRGFRVSSTAFAAVGKHKQHLEQHSQAQRLKKLGSQLGRSTRRSASSYHHITTTATSNADLLVKLGATVAALGGGYYLYNNDQERLALYRLGHSTYRIANLVGTTAVIGLDYGLSLAYYHRFQRNTIQTEYETKYTLLQKLQGDQQTITMKMIQCKRMLEDLENGIKFDRYNSDGTGSGEQNGTAIDTHESGDGTHNREHLLHLIDFYQKQILENRQEMEQLSKELDLIYKGNQQEDGYEQFYSQLHRRNAKRLRNMCAANGGVYIKIGQHIAMLDHVVPPEYHEYLCTLLANTPTSSMNSVRRIFKEDFGKLPEEIFDEFETIPIASASLAQVHVAKKDGIKYAVKVQHEGLREGTDVDRYVITTLVHYLHKIFPEFNYDWLTKEMNTNIPPELDFNNEKYNIYKAKETLQSFIKSEDIAIPTPIEDKCSSRVITMTFEEGVYISRIRNFTQYDLNPAEISTLISKVFAEQIFKHGFVHCGKFISLSLF